jgi:hypothetical protein
MGSLLGNMIGFFLLIVSAAIAFYSVEAATIVFACIAYVVFAVVWTLERLGRPARDQQMILMLKQGVLPTDEIAAAYSQYHIYLAFPAVGQCLSALLNNLRVVGLGWAALAFWNGFWWSGAANAGCFFVFGTACVRLDPVLYMRSAAAAGQPFARGQLRVISSLIEARQSWLASLDRRHSSANNDDPPSGRE